MDLARHYTGWGLVNRWAVQVLAQLQAHAPWREAVRADLANLADAPDDHVTYLTSLALVH